MTCRLESCEGDDINIIRPGDDMIHSAVLLNVLDGNGRRLRKVLLSPTGTICNIVLESP